MKKTTTLEDLKSNFGTNTVYGKIEGDYLNFKGKYYKITHVFPGALELDTDKLFGQYGDEFPLELIK
jgi:hypothetical protein